MKIRSLLIILILIATSTIRLTQTTSASSNNFLDVPTSQWFAPYVREIARQGIISGYRDDKGSLTGYFGPGDSLSIGESLKILSGTLDISPIPNQDEHWAHAYYMGLKNAGLNIDIPSHRYDRRISRLLLVQIIADLLDLSDKYKPFKDINDRQVGAVAHANIISGHPDGTFRPFNALLRAEMAKIAVNIINYQKLKTTTAKNSQEINVIIVWLYAYEALPTEQMNLLKADENNINSFLGAAKWLKEQAANYDIDLNINFNYSPEQYQLPERLIVNNIEESLSTNLYQYVIDRFPTYKAYNIIVPFYYSSERFAFETHASLINSFTLFSMKFDEDIFSPPFYNTSYSETFVHELAHLLGSTDKYSCPNENPSICEIAKETGTACTVPSDANNNMQKDLMCNRKPVYLGSQWGFETYELDELFISEATAGELDW